MRLPTPPSTICRMHAVYNEAFRARDAGRQSAVMLLRRSTSYGIRTALSAAKADARSQMAKMRLIIWTIMIECTASGTTRS